MERGCWENGDGARAGEASAAECWARGKCEVGERVWRKLLQSLFTTDFARSRRFARTAEAALPCVLSGSGDYPWPALFSSGPRFQAS